MCATSITLVVSPYHVGAYNKAVGKGPLALLNGGLANQLRDQGLKVDLVELEAVDEFEGEIGKSFELLRRTSKAVTRALDGNSFPVVLAGNCSSSVGVAAGISASSHAEVSEKPLGCIWFDAHDDFNTPDVLTSGYFDSMPIAMLAGLCWRTLLQSIPGFRSMDLAKNFIHCGMRDVSNLERSRVKDAGFSVVWGDIEKNVDFEGELHSVLASKEFQPTMVHLDLDALDTSVGRANKFSAPGGLLEEDLVGCLGMIPSERLPVSLTVASFDPSFDNGGKVPPVAIRAVVGFVEKMIAFGHIVPKC